MRFADILFENGLRKPLFHPWSEGLLKPDCGLFLKTQKDVRIDIHGYCDGGMSQPFADDLEVGAGAAQGALAIANSRLELVRSIAYAGGPALAGALVGGRVTSSNPPNGTPHTGHFDPLPCMTPRVHSTHMAWWPQGTSTVRLGFDMHTTHSFT